jgi:small subunit ribosomal protein S6
LNHYEMLCILDAKLAEDEMRKAEEVVKMEIDKVKGRIENIESMGRRRLAYPIGIHNEGLYLLTRFSGPPASISALNSNLKLNSVFIRALIVRSKNPPPLVLDKPEGQKSDSDRAFEFAGATDSSEHVETEEIKARERE